MAGGGSGIQETSAQRALAQHAQLVMNDYKARWLPVQQQLAAQIEAEGKPGSWQRTEAAGKASTDTAIKFGQARGALESALTNRGAAPGSGRFDAGVAGLSASEAKSSGLGQMMSDQQITDAYTKGLGALVSIGQGQSAEVSQGLTGQAQASGMQAEADAQAALADQMAVGGAVGTALGMGAQQYMGSRPPPTHQGSNPYGYNGTLNNPSAYVNIGTS